MKSKGYQPVAPFCVSSHTDNFADDDMDLDDDDDVPDPVLPEGPITCYLYLKNPYRHVGQGILHNGPNLILHGVPLPEEYSKIQFQVAVDSEKQSRVPEPTDEVRNVGEAVGHFISRPKKLVALEIKQCTPLRKSPKKNQNVRTVKTVESTFCTQQVGYPKSGDDPHSSVMLHLLKIAPEKMLSNIEVDFKTYFSGESWKDSIVGEHIKEVLNDAWLSFTSVAFYLRYLGDVYLSENVDLAAKFSFVSPHIAPVVANVISANALRDRLLKFTGQDHLLLMPRNVGAHWVLIAINTRTESIYYMDPAHNVKCTLHPDLQKFVENAHKSLSSTARWKYQQSGLR